MRQSAPYGHIDEEKPQRRIFETLGGLIPVELPPQQHRGNCHRGRLRNQRAQHGGKRQNRQPPGRRPKMPQPRHPAQQIASKRDDRPRRCNCHNDHYEKRFGVVAPVDVLVGRSPALEEREH